MVNGSFTDRIGGRNTLLIGLALQAASFALFPLIHHPWQAFALLGLGALLRRVRGMAFAGGMHCARRRGVVFYNPGGPGAAGTAVLGNYTATMSCSNTVTGSTTSLPNAVGGTITLRPGDSITCVITNTRRALAFLVITKTSAVISDPVNGSRHDNYCREESGVLLTINRRNWIGDKGYIGNNMITPFRKPAGGELLDWQKEYNSEVNKIRWMIEQVISHFKNWTIMHTDYRRPLKTFETTISAVVGLHFYRTV